MFFEFLNEEIPQEFYSDANNEPFQACSVCETSLENRMYMIEKSYRKYPNTNETFTAFEYGICMDCKKEMMQEISKESMQKIQSFVQENQSDFEFAFDSDEEFNIEKCMSQCSFSEKHISEMEEYNMIGFFRGNRMIQIPFIFGENVIEEYANLLSDETLGFFDDFMNRINDLPPSLAKLLDSKNSPILI